MGGLISTQYYVASAHTNDRTGPENAVGVAAALLFLYCIGRHHSARSRPP